MASLIKILNSMIGERYFPNEGVWRWVNDPTITGNKTTSSDEPLSNKELVEITNWRFTSDQKASITAVFGDPDFLPFSFLNKGVACGAAVCRLVRYYGCAYVLINPQKPDEPNPQQDQGLQLLIDVLKKQNQNRLDNNMSLFSALNLAEILSIKPEERESFFQGHEAEPLSALTIEKLRKLMPMAFGTGFLVGKNYLLTNHHVLPSREYAGEFLAQFGYEKDILGRITLPIEYELDEYFFVTNSVLDYTLVKVRPHSNLGDAGDNFGYLRMMEDPRAIAPPLTPKEVEIRNIESELSDKAKQRLNKPNLKGEILGLPGAPVNIIQHPKVQPKEVVLSSNRVQEITRDFIRYEADVDFSSSGSPVLNQQWQLVGLHHASLADKDFNILGQEGIRISRIAEDLRNKRVHLDFIVFKLQEAVEIIQDCTDRWEIAEFTIHTKLDDRIFQATKDKLALNPKTLEVIKEHQNAQEKAGLDFASIDAESIKSKLLTFVAEGTNEAAEQLETMEYLGDSIAPFPLAEDNIAWVRDNAAFIENYALNIQNYASDLQEFVEAYIDDPVIHRVYRSPE